MVGEPQENSNGEITYSIYTHKKLDIGYNGKQIVDVNLTSENKIELHPGKEINFSYEVNWKKSSIKFEDRFDKYLDPNFFQHRVNKLTLWNISKILNNYSTYKIITFRFIGSVFSIVL